MTHSNGPVRMTLQDMPVGTIYRASGQFYRAIAYEKTGASSRYIQKIAEDRLRMICADRDSYPDGFEWPIGGSGDAVFEVVEWPEEQSLECAECGASIYDDDYLCSRCRLAIC